MERLYLSPCLLLLTLTVVGQEPKKKPLAVEDLYLLDAPKAMTLAPDGRTRGVHPQLDRRRHRERSATPSGSWKDPAIGPGRLNRSNRTLACRCFPRRQMARVSVHASPSRRLEAVPAASRRNGIRPSISQLDARAGGQGHSSGRPERPYGRVLNDGFYGRIAFAPDSRRLVFVADDGKDPHTAEEIANDVLIVRPDQGEG